MLSDKLIIAWGQNLAWGHWVGRDFYIHEECFNDWMDRRYGRGNWMGLGYGEQDGCGGFYITTANIPGGYEGIGIYYTEYEREELEDE